MLPRLLLCTVAATLLSACASRSVEVKPLAANPADFAGWTCDALHDEIERVQQRAADVAYAVDAHAGNNLIALSVGAVMFWPALLAMRPDGPEAVELAKLKGRHEALVGAAQAKRCPPVGDALPAVRAAALPVALGERLVYEERMPGGNPARELGFRLSALKRGELAFELDRGEPNSVLPWRQDAAGNVLTPPPHPIVSWSHLLRRQLTLGDVLAGELHSPDSERHGHLRGQVVALGRVTVAGRVFDGATIELSGDVPHGPEHGSSSTRIEGVMEVDRASGVLLRLDLRSGNRHYAVRRKLLRIEPASQPITSS
jgi:hypothetical protein